MLHQNCHSRTLFQITMGLVLLVAVTEARAQLGSRETKEWIQNLDRPERIAGLKIDKVLPLLKLKPGGQGGGHRRRRGRFLTPFRQGSRAIGDSLCG